MNTTLTTNKHRLYELDIVKAIAILFMVFDHLLEEGASDVLAESSFADFIYFMAMIPAAPVFMFLMGLGFIYSRNRDNYSYFFKRGGTCTTLSLYS